MQARKRTPNERLRHARELRGWGQKDLAAKLDLLDERAIRRWETGESLPSPYYRQRLCTVFGMNAEELGFLDPVPAPAEPPLRDAVQETKAFPLVPQDQNRQRLLKRVHMFWIAGVLDQSLHEAVLLTLGLEERLEALANPWHLALQQPQHPPRMLPADTPIEAVFDQASGEMLILGEPGSGKTTLLLALTRCLLDRATRDETHPLPVVFHLASWALNRPPLTRWLVDELHDKYQVPRTLGQTWVESDHVIPLLDGLDEVAPAFRAACIEAINAFLSEHTVSLVVCSRRADYFAQSARLHLMTAVLVQPLTSEQIDGYLGQLGERLMPIRQVVKYDLALQELVQTPLMLNILILAYEGQPVDDLLARPGPVTSLQRQLFTVYVERMLQRRQPFTRYTPQQIRQWLTALATQMSRQSQSELYLERLQPDWLAGRHVRGLYQGVTTLGFMVVGGLVGALVFVLYGGLIFGVSMGVIFGLLFRLVFGLGGQIHPAEELAWSWEGFWQHFPRALGTGLVFGLGGGLVIGTIGVMVGVPTFGLAFGLVFVPIGVLIGSLQGGFSEKMVETRRLVRPNQGIWLSAQNSIRSGLIGGLAGGLVGWLSDRVVGGMFFTYRVSIGLPGLLLGVVIGLLVGGLAKGGRAYIQHYALRLLLWHSGVLPWRCVPFLEYATECILLRKVGGGYIFVHRLLQEYFAHCDSLPSPTSNAQARNERK